MTHDPASWMKTVECDKLDGKSCVIQYSFCGMELDGMRSDSYVHC